MLSDTWVSSQPTLGHGPVSKYSTSTSRSNSGHRSFAQHPQRTKPTAAHTSLPVSLLNSPWVFSRAHLLNELEYFLALGLILELPKWRQWRPSDKLAKSTWRERTGLRSSQSLSSTFHLKSFRGISALSWNPLQKNSDLSAKVTQVIENKSDTFKYSSVRSNYNYPSFLQSNTIQLSMTRKRQASMSKLYC
jgi:hypothetical protein